MIHLKAITDTLPFDVKEDYLVLRKAINDCIYAIEELQIQSQFQSEHLAKVMPEVWGESRYTIAELREKIDEYNKFPGIMGYLNDFLEWLEEDSKKGY